MAAPDDTIIIITPPVRPKLTKTAAESMSYHDARALIDEAERDGADIQIQMPKEKKA